MVKTRKLVSMLLVVAMMLTVVSVGIVAASAVEGSTYYLIGSMSGWKFVDDMKFTRTANEAHEEYSATVTLKTSDSFKAAMTSKGGSEEAGDAQGWYPDGVENNLSVDKYGEYTVYFRPNGDGEDDWVDCKYDDGSGVGGGAQQHGGKMFYFVLNKELTETTPDETTPDESTPDEKEMITVYFTNTENWTNVGVYYWNDGPTWPGTAMTVYQEDNGFGQTVYQGQVAADAEGIIFNGDGVQTNDIKSGIVDGAGWYAEKTEDNKYNAVPWATESTEDEQTPDEQPTDAPVAGGTSITFNGETIDAHVGDKVTVTVTLSLAGVPVDGDKVGKLTELEGSIFYDKSKLKLTSVFNADEEDFASVLPNIEGGTISVSDDADDRLGYSAMKKAGYDFSEEKVLATAEFEVIAEGASEIISQVACIGSGEVRMIEDNVVNVEPTVLKSEIAIDCPHTPATHDEPTEAKPTEPKPTEPKPAYSTVTIVDWDGTETVKYVNVGDELVVTTYLTVPEDKRVNSIDVHVDFNVDAEMVEFAYDMDDDDDWAAMFPILADATANVEGNSVKANFSGSGWKQGKAFPEGSVLIQTKFNVVAEGNSKIVVDILKLATVDKSSAMEVQIDKNEKVGSDDLAINTTTEGGSDTAPTEPHVTPDPTTPAPLPTSSDDQPATPGEQTPDEPLPADGLFVVADGVPYKVEQGQIIDYIFYLNTGEKLCSLDADTFYDITGLELLTDVEDPDTMFPIIKDSMIYNTFDGNIKYNYSNARGKDFNTDDSQLIHLQFKVTADKGVYEINTLLHTVAGADEHKYIFQNEVLDPLKYAAGELLGLDPWIGDLPDNPTQAPTTAPTSSIDEEPTSAGTDAPTTVTEAPTTETKQSTGDEPKTNPTPIKTGTTEMALIFLAVMALAAGAVVFTKKRED